MPSTAIDIQQSSHFDIQDDDFVKALQSGCEFRFKYLYDHYAPALMGIILRTVKNEVLAKEILADTFVRIWNSVQHYQNSKVRLFTWMTTIARNTANERLSAGQAMYKKTADAKYTPGQILELIYFKGITHEQAAEALNMPVTAVKTIIRQAIATLRRSS